MNELVRLNRNDLDRLRYENTIAALQSRVKLLVGQLEKEKKDREKREEAHSRAIRELNLQIADPEDANAQIARLHEALADKCAALEALSQELANAQRELAHK